MTTQITFDNLIYCTVKGCTYRSIIHYHCPVKGCDFIYKEYIVAYGYDAQPEGMTQHIHCSLCNDTKFHVHCNVKECDRKDIHIHCDICEKNHDPAVSPGGSLPYEHGLQDREHSLQDCEHSHCSYAYPDEHICNYFIYLNDKSHTHCPKCGTIAIEGSYHYHCRTEGCARTDEHNHCKTDGCDRTDEHHHVVNFIHNIFKYGVLFP